MYKNLCAFKGGSYAPTKLIVIMKLIALLIPLFVLKSYGTSIAQQVSIRVKEATLEEVIAKLKPQTAYKFYYDIDMVKKANPLTLDIANATLENALEKCFEGQPLYYSIRKGIVVIHPREKNATSALSKLVLQQQTVRGKVLDEKGEPLEGVSIKVKHAMATAFTDRDGTFGITVDATQKNLVFSYLGYRTVEHVIPQNRQDLLVHMEPEEKGMEEVIVVGYGTQLKRDVTGAITSIKAKDLRERPVTSVRQMLLGRGAGVYVTNNGNRPGNEATVLIRGRRSFNAGNDPLYVIDGIPINGGFNDINPDDVASIEILKDASAVAIYGSRGANGVVLITTKRGVSGEPAIRYNTYFGLSNPVRYIDLMDGNTFAEYKRESRRAYGRYDDSDPEADAELFDPIELEMLQSGQYTDWQRLVVKNGQRQNHELNVSGSGDKTSYSVSLGYFNEEGYLPGQYFTRYTSRINLDQQVGQRVEFGLSTLGSFSQQSSANSFGLSLFSNPLSNPYDAAGDLLFYPTNDVTMPNPLADLVEGAVINRAKRFRLLTSLYGQIKITDDLSYRINVGPDLVYAGGGDFRASNTSARNQGLSSAGVNGNLTVLYTIENLINFKKTVAKKHRFDVTALYSISARTNEGMAANVQDLPVDQFEYYNLGAASQINGVGSSFEKWSILSYMGRINYSFTNRFSLTLTGRADGSSRFSTNEKWGFFPSAAIAYNLHEEAFSQRLPALDQLKIRLSYGKVGNTGINPYATQGLLGRTVYEFGGSEAYGYRPTSIRNDNLRWESTASANLGIDFAWFNNRLSGTVEVYRSRTTDLLLPRVLPISGGFGEVLENVGATRNTGVEITLSSTNVQQESRGNFRWATDFNIATNKEEILELSQGKVDDVGNLRFIGKPISVYYDYNKIGIWQLGEEEEAAKFNSSVGQVRVLDRNGNGVVDQDDRMYLGTTVPKWTGGMNNRFQYHGFELSIFVQGRWGNKFRSEPHQGNTFALQGRYNNLNVDYWTESNPTNAYPQPNFNQTRQYASTLNLFDASFLRVRNIYLGYDVAPGLAQRIAAKGLNVYASVQDPFIVSPYVQRHNGTDPEISGSPSLVTYTLGIRANF